MPIFIVVFPSLRGDDGGVERIIADEQRRFLDAQRIARLATADAEGRTHVVPVCYALADDNLYFTIDEKPKRGGGTRP